MHWNDNDDDNQLICYLTKILFIRSIVKQKTTNKQNIYLFIYICHRYTHSEYSTNSTIYKIHTRKREKKKLIETRNPIYSV